MNPETLELRDYLAILRARRWTVIFIVAAVMGAAVAISLVQTPMYRSTARVLVKPIPAGASVAYSIFPNLKTESELISSAPVAERVREQLGGEPPLPELLAGLKVRHVLDTEVLAVEYLSDDPALAQAAANAFAAQYIAARQEEALDAVASTERALRLRMDEIRDGIARAAEVAENARRARDGAAEAAQAEAERSVLTARLGVLEQRLDEMRPDMVALAGGEIIEPAALPARPASPNHVRNGALGLVLGLMLGVGAALFREYLSDRLRGGHEVENLIGVPVLGAVPRYEPVGAEPVLVSEPESAASEAYRSLRTHIGYLLDGRPTASVLITSPGEAEGKTSTTANLGIAFAKVGRRVCLVSADLRQPAIERCFDLHSGWGLSRWLADGAPNGWPSPLASPVPNLDVLTSGPIPDHPAELLSSNRFPALIRELGRRYDLVLVDSPPALLLADAASMAAHLDATVLVLDATATPSSAAVEAKLKLERVGARIIGCVLNAYDQSSPGYGYHRPYQRYGEPGAKQSNGTNGGSRGPQVTRPQTSPGGRRPEAARSVGRLLTRFLDPPR